MQLVPAETSLVIAGAWNPAILTPNWVLRHGLNRPVGQEEQVQVFVPTGAGMIFEFPRYALPEFTFVVRPDTLVLAPSDRAPERFEIMEDAAAAMIEALRHTPINGVGHNFEYRDSEPTPAHLEVFSRSRQDVADHMPDGWDAAAAMIGSSFRKEDGSAVLSVSRQFDAGSIAVKFNFHHPVSNVDQALQLLRGQGPYARMSQNFEFAKTLINSLYGGE